MWIMDAYRKENKITLWIKTVEDDLRKEYDYSTSIFAEPSAAEYLKRKKINFFRTKKKNYLRDKIDVLEVPVPEISSYESFVRGIEQGTRFRIGLYNADIKPEQMFLYTNNLRPCGPVMIENNKIIQLKDEYPVPLKKLELTVVEEKGKVVQIELGKKLLHGREKDILEKFSLLFRQLDPDVIFMDYAYSKMPVLYARLKHHGIFCPLHRWDDTEIKYRGGRSYWSYGQVRYQDYAVRLRGRFLVDKNTFVGTECDPEGVVEMAYLSGTLFQATASRSFGAVFQTALVRKMIRHGFIVSHKEKPLDKPLNLIDMLKCDRGAHTCDPIVGFHRNVAEIDFTSMFPWLIYNHNIGADTILTKHGPFSNLPNVPIRTSLAFKGLIPITLKPFIDRRMHYKKNPTAVNKRRAHALKWVLVSCYGYLRFREFKLGIPTSHMAICALARETLLEVAKLAEDRGFEVIHGIVDSLYIKKKGINDKEIKEFCREVELMTGIPISFEGIFKWVVFLPSVIQKERPLPATYYGVFKDGRIKARGIEVRQRSSPTLVKIFQEHVLKRLSKCDTENEVRQMLPELCRDLREFIKRIDKFDKKYFVVPIRVSKTHYVNNIPQKIILQKLKKKGMDIRPGQFINFVYSNNGVCLPEEFENNPDVEQYKKLLVRSLFIVMQPFGAKKEYIYNLVGTDRQAKLTDYMKAPRPWSSSELITSGESFSGELILSETL